mmetsp:Transcript_27703/g.45808  ORF Transcript_27703/g.45808 Transcript_27703/m.45808 type:complete len:339 (+) Transcript_27703:192-1208(+)
MVLTTPSTKTAGQTSRRHANKQVQHLQPPTSSGTPACGQPAYLQPRPVFALTPADAMQSALVTMQGPLDYSSSIGQLIWKTTVHPLESKLYNGSQHGFLHFLKAFKLRAKEFHWTNTLQVPQDDQVYDLTAQYHILTVDSITQHVLMYIKELSRDAQNSIMIWKCLKNSFTPKLRNSIERHSHIFKVNGVPDGLLYFKVLIQIVQPNTRTTIANINHKLESLDSMMVKVDYNVKQFNEHVQVLVDALAAAGETPHNLVQHLWKGYRACADKSFLDYIKRRHQDWNHGMDITPKQLMMEAEEEYQSLVDDQVWLEPSAEEKQISALVAQLQELNSRMKD